MQKDATPPANKITIEPTRKPYSPPRLEVYGLVRELTAGGSFGANEFGVGSGMGKGMDPFRRP